MSAASFARSAYCAIAAHKGVLYPGAGRAARKATRLTPKSVYGEFGCGWSLVY